MAGCLQRVKQTDKEDRENASATRSLVRCPMDDPEAGKARETHWGRRGTACEGTSGMTDDVAY